ncbi:hypothetical protein PABG_01414 [Paracoccidioides brasiliensis Pb03]|uniref:Selenoprotein W-like protein n=2 Tax=Paracoccidioides brasiliensis TaxID=121759 RepID=C1G9S7_PARBD|nr:uncharacterized protein PADG_04013 [Paracoccidioides brasiliensis Pb18]EEH19095.1 hypothetical protein PABG_01414 [Paracoccidioides brasiliensis Pb03]EEH47929.1 hypothetical protein PADG_04013 [Paracoccidioides brasiliensis Pb18]ODH13698.1 hypothetical protein ACO22_06989 [Paracoccidioides brasiliensis]ODH45960.1 hypothetical protein GX48_07957 [Paracoccidioides brasiliensis]
MADLKSHPTDPAPADDQQQTQAQQRDQQDQQTSIPLTEKPTARIHLPRVTIKYCTQCKWMLRAAYFAQELLSTFSTALGEVSLVPATGGVFTVAILHESNVDFSTEETVLWDRKTQGGFPEVKQLKALVRNVVDPSRDLGHIDRALAEQRSREGISVSGAEEKGGRGELTQTQKQTESTTAEAGVCEDCE